MPQGDMGLLQYLAVLDRKAQELRAALAEIEIAAKHARGVIGGGGIIPATLPSPEPEQPEKEPNSSNGPYAGMTNPNAAVAFLRTSGKPQKTAAIARALLAGGITTEAKDFSATMFGTMRRLVEDKRVVKAGPGLWAIPGASSDSQLPLDTE
jgi:hypothetical protein